MSNVFKEQPPQSAGVERASGRRKKPRFKILCGTQVVFFQDYLASEKPTFPEGCVRAVHKFLKSYPAAKFDDLMFEWEDVRTRE